MLTLECFLKVCIHCVKGPILITIICIKEHLPPYGHKNLMCGLCAISISIFFEFSNTHTYSELFSPIIPELINQSPSRLICVIRNFPGNSNAATLQRVQLECVEDSKHDPTYLCPCVHISRKSY